MIENQKKQKIEIWKLKKFYINIHIKIGYELNF